MTTFKEINQIDVSDHVEKKMNLSYLSWAWAHQEMKKIDENADIKIHEFPDTDKLIKMAEKGANITPELAEIITVNYKKDNAGAYVKVSVTLNERTETEYLPVMNFKNKSMVNPDSMAINKAHKRCFVKALALHGLGLYIYSGEDLPEKPTPKIKTVNNEQVKLLKDVLREYARTTGNGDEAGIGKLEAWALGQLGVDNFSDVPASEVTPFIKRMEKMIDKAKPKEKKKDESQDSLFEGNTTKPKE